MSDIFYDIRFQTSMGDDVEITTMIMQKAIALYNRCKEMKNCVVIERTMNERGEEIERNVTADIKDMNEQWDLILGKVQR